IGAVGTTEGAVMDEKEPPNARVTFIAEQLSREHEGSLLLSFSLEIIQNDVKTVLPLGSRWSSKEKTAFESIFGFRPDGADSHSAAMVQVILSIAHQRVDEPALSMELEAFTKLGNFAKAVQEEDVRNITVKNLRTWFGPGGGQSAHCKF